jgi:adhesin/invasin
VFADGTTSTITVQAVDADAVDLTASGGAVTLTASNQATVSTVTDNGDGTYSATISSNRPGVATISGTIDGNPISGTATVDFADPGVGGATGIVANPISAPADGTSTVAITVHGGDGGGVPLTASGGLVTLASTVGTMGAVTDNGNGTYSATLTAPTTAGTATITGTIDGNAITTINPVVTFTAGPAAGNATTISANPSTVPADGTSQAVITVQAEDANGNGLSTGGDAVVLTAIGASGPQTAAATLSLPSDTGTGTYTATLSSTMTGPVTITGTIDGQPITTINPVVVTFSVPAEGADTFITANLASVPADGTSTVAITVQGVDATAADLSASGGLVTLASSAGTIGVVTDNGDGTYSATLTAPFAPGTTTISATITGTIAGNAIGGTATVNFTDPADDANTLILTNVYTVPADGTSTVAITVLALDVFTNYISASGGLVTLATSAGTLGPVTDNGDGTYSATLTAPFAPGTATITGTIDGNAIPFANTGMVVFTGPATGANTFITTNPASVPADGSSTVAITVQAVDAYGNPLATGGDTVTLTSTAGLMGAVTDNTDGTYGASLTAPLAPGAPTSSATITGTIDGNPIGVIATVDFNDPAEAADTFITASPGSVPADGTSTVAITVQGVDATATDLSASGGLVTLASSAGTIGVVTDNGDGTYSATLTAPFAPGTTTISATVTGTIDGNAIGVTTTVGFTDPAAYTFITANPASVPADGTSPVAITVQGVGADRTSGSTVVLASSAGTIGVVTDNGDGTYSATLTAPLAAGSPTSTATITGTIDGNPIGGTATVDFTDPATTGANYIFVNPPSVPADGTSMVAVTVQAGDVNGVPLTTSGGLVTLASTEGTIGVVTDTGDGTYSATLTAPLAPGTPTTTATISGTIDGGTIYNPATVDFTEPPTGAATVIMAALATVPADGTSTVAITVQAAAVLGTNLTTTSGVVTLASTAGAIGPVTDYGNGTYGATLTAPFSPGAPISATIDGTIDGLTIVNTTTVDFTDPADGASSQILAPATVPADGTSTVAITVQAVDADSINLTTTGGTVVLMSSAGTISPVTDHGDGTYTATLMPSTTIGPVLITGTIDGNAIGAGTTVTFTDPPDGGNTTINATPANVFADGTTSTITVQAVDADAVDVNASGGLVTLTATNQATVSTVTDNGDGTYSATISSNTPGVATITGTIDGNPISGTATVDFADPAAGGATDIFVDPPSAPADGTSTVAITVQAGDPHGVPLTASGGLVTLASTEGTIGEVTDNGNGTYRATLTAPLAPGTPTTTATISGTINGGTINNPATVDFTEPATGGASRIMAAPGSALANGTSTVTITVQAEAVPGTNLTTTSGVVTLASTAGTMGPVTDHLNGTYSATLTAPTTAGTATITGTIDGLTITNTTTVDFT